MISLRSSAAVAFVALFANPFTPPRAAAAANPFEFKDGDRVVFLGSTLIEREQKYGYWELALTLLNKDKNVTFRNLGWSGDTVWGEARNVFDQSPGGFNERLVKETIKRNPTVIVICYGHNESFDGAPGVAKFAAQLEKLIDAVAVTKARIVLMSPTPFEKAAVLPDPEPNNKNLALYVDAIKATATKRKLEFVDLFAMIRSSRAPDLRLTYNGLHLDENGYLVTASAITDPPYARTSATELRQAIIAKNELVFHQWRPQNVTYLFLFRKHEQGNNAKDIPAFDPLIAKMEAEIQELKKASK